MNDLDSTKTQPLLSVRDLRVDFKTFGGTVQAVRGVSFDVYPGEVLAIVGESGCGKSVTAQSLLGLIPCPPGRIPSGAITMDGKDLLKISQAEMSRVRGRDISMIFQDPLTSLNPTMTIGAQIAEVIRRHFQVSNQEARNRTVEILKLVQIPEAEKRLNQYPHEFSGGMRQRIMIAIALACRPRILIADEPTTALDVTIQEQILTLIRGLRHEIDMAVILITHDLGVVASVADRVAVMYAGEIVEQGTVDEIFESPKHPYTVGLHRAIPNPVRAKEDPTGAASRLIPIPGAPPDLFAPPLGCSFAERCPAAMAICISADPPVFTHGNSPTRVHSSRCWLHHEHATDALRSQGLSVIQSSGVTR